MTWTLWKQPRLTQELESDEISFEAEPGRLTFNSISERPVKGVSNFYGGLITVESTAIAFSDFGFDVAGETVEAIELFLHVSRLGRTQDKVISLYYNKPIGKNLSDLSATDEFTYSGDLKHWGVDKKNIDFASPDFGVVVDLQPHTEYPCNVTVYLRKVQVRLKLA